MSDRRPLIVFATFLAIMAGIVLLSQRGEDPKTTASNDDSSTVETTSTTAAGATQPNSGTKTTGTTAKIEIPTTIPNAGPDQYRSILERLIALQNDLLQSPDPSRVGEIMDPKCACYTQTRQGLQVLVDRKWHVQGPSTGISAAALVSKSDTEMRISTTLVSLGNPTVDQNGNVQKTSERGPLTPILYVLKKNTNGRWLITDRQTYEER